MENGYNFLKEVVSVINGSNIFPTHSLSVVKLEIEEAKDNPVIKSFAIY